MVVEQPLRQTVSAKNLLKHWQTSKTDSMGNISYIIIKYQMAFYAIFLRRKIYVICKNEIEILRR